MGTHRVSHRADLQPVHAMIFRRLKAGGFDWRYSFPSSRPEAIVAARSGPPPRTVAAYRQVFGRFPEGWPPQIE